VHRRVFDLGALYYDAVTAWQPEWRADCARLAAHVSDDARLIVDLGCGPGTSAFEVASHRPHVLILGLDVSHLMLKRAIRNRARYPASESRVQFVRADAAGMPLAPRSVDAVTSHSSFYLVPDRRRVLDEVVRVLRPGGRVIMFEPRRERRAVPDLRTWLDRPRFAWTMTVWGLASRVDGAFAKGELASLLTERGLTVSHDDAALDGFGWLVVAQSPG
jgi:ubiquinone/menaquinone biosynthesis C-methylase UbiE